MKMLGFILTAVLEFLVFYYLYNLHKKYEYLTKEKTNGRTYIVRPCIQTYYIGCVAYIFSLVMFYLTLLLALLGAFSMGIAQFFLVLGILSDALLFYSTKWQVIVLGRRIVVKKYFFKAYKISVTDIDYAVRLYTNTKFGNFERLYIYKDTKKVASMNSTATNYKRFVKKLENWGKLKN